MLYKLFVNWETKPGFENPISQELIRLRLKQLFGNTFEISNEKIQLLKLLIESLITKDVSKRFNSMNVFESGILQKLFENAKINDSADKQSKKSKIKEIRDKISLFVEENGVDDPLQFGNFERNSIVLQVENSFKDKIFNVGCQQSIEQQKKILCGKFRAEFKNERDVDAGGLSKKPLHFKKT